MTDGHHDYCLILQMVQSLSLAKPSEYRMSMPVKDEAALVLEKPLSKCCGFIKTKYTKLSFTHS